MRDSDPRPVRSPGRPDTTSRLSVRPSTRGAFVLMRMDETNAKGARTLMSVEWRLPPDVARRKALEMIAAADEADRRRQEEEGWPER